VALTRAEVDLAGEEVVAEVGSAGTALAVVVVATLAELVVEADELVTGLEELEGVVTTATDVGEEVAAMEVVIEEAEGATETAAADEEIAAVVVDGLPYVSTQNWTKKKTTYTIGEITGA
jgi:hypothetical protein